MKTFLFSFKNFLSFFLFFYFLTFFGNHLKAQLVINEGSNRNYSTIDDEDGEYSDWIEIYNSGDETVNLLNYSLSDRLDEPLKWVFPNIEILAGEFKTIYCSGKDRKPIAGFENVAYITDYTPVTNWNTHNLNEPFYWDGISNILINVCAYNSYQYTSNSVFNQTETDYNSTVYAVQDGTDAICFTGNGTCVNLRPNMKLNDAVIGTGTIQNGNTEYPAPYGNWYWAAKHQMLITAEELTAAGLTEGNITSIAFDVVSTDPNTIYSYIDISMKLVVEDHLTSQFVPLDLSLNQHTNFGINNTGETIYLFSPSQNLLSQLNVNCQDLDNSVGSFPDASSNITIFAPPTPAATNNESQTFSAYLLPPVFSEPSGIYNSTIQISISNPNTTESLITYTLDGSDPTIISQIYYGGIINISSSKVLKAKAFAYNFLPSPLAASSYLFNVNHTTPIVSVVTDNANLYGENGIFDNWQFDWEKAAYVEYFDTDENLIFSQAAGMQIDGGAGGSRSNPQHSFRIELAHSVLGSVPVDYQLIPNRPERTTYSKFYLRNGSNQYLTIPYKDAALVTATCDGTKNYFSSMEPVSVYINGEYFGLYELREKIDAEYFDVYENADAETLDILTLSYWYGLVLRATEGSTEHFFTAFDDFLQIDPEQNNFWDEADQYFDLEYYTDYILAESYAGNRDWPYNNIKIYRSDKTNYRFRFCVVDLELCLNPNGWTSTADDPIGFLFSTDQNIPYIKIWHQCIQNEQYRNYFINRFADLMNTAYNTERILSVENEYYEKMLPEMPNEFERWGDPNQIPQQMEMFNNNHEILQSELSARTGYVREFINTGFELGGQVSVTVDATPANAGKIKINTVIPNELPWTGVYFNGNPVTISAIPNAGYEFDYWQPNPIIGSGNNNQTINVNIFTSANFTAVFDETQVEGILSISEINYHSDSTRDAGDWIEFHNYGNSALDISGWWFTDSNVANVFEFQAGTILQPDERIILAEDLNKFNSQHNVTENIWEMGFGFKNSGEQLTLYDNFDLQKLSLNYTDSLEWQVAADGYGRTLELADDELNPALPESWFAGCIGGSPATAYYPCNEAIIFSEINYNSKPEADAGDWVELFNRSDEDIVLANWKFRDEDNLHTFAINEGVVIPAGEYLVLYSNLDLFSTRFPNVDNCIGTFNFGLGGKDDALRLFDEAGTLYQSVVYSNVAPWPQGAAGNGYTLELLDYNGIINNGSNWIDGCPEGSPGKAFQLPCPPNNITEAELDAQFQIFPNPTTGTFAFTGKGLLKGEYKFTCRNILGQIVFIENHEIDENSFHKNFSLSEMEEGLYFLSIEFVEEQSVIKVLPIIFIP